MSLLWAKRGWLTPGSQTLRTLERFGATDAWDFVDNSYMRAGVVTTNAGLTVTRASSGYAETTGGVLVPFASGELRRTDRGVLVEGARTNLLLRSQEFDDAAWTKFTNAATLTTNATTAPDGTLTAEKITASTSSNNQLIRQGPTIVASTVYQFSVFAKAAEYNRLLLTVWDNVANQFASTLFNLTAGTFVLGISGNGGNQGVGNFAATMTPLSNGWYRCAISFSSTSTTGNVYAGVYNADTFLNGLPTQYAGDGTSGIFLWGAQLEAASFASSYIPTVASTVTRAADEVLVNPYTFPAPFSAYAEYVPGGNAASQNTALSFAVATTNEQVHIGKDVGGTNTNEAQLYVQNAGDQAWIRHAAGTANVGATVRQAVRVGANDFASSVGGSAALTDTSGTVPTMDRIRFGTDRGSTAFLFGYLRRAAIFPSALSDAQLQAITT